MLAKRSGVEQACDTFAHGQLAAGVLFFDPFLTAHGGLEKLEYQNVPVPRPAAGQVLVQVTATAKNNTDRKAREGLYPTKDKGDVTSFQMGGSATLTFPRVQGADVVGRIVAVGQGVEDTRIGQRGLLDFNIYANDRTDINLTPDYYGHGADGGYAEYVDDPAGVSPAVERALASGRPSLVNVSVRSGASPLAEATIARRMGR